jgi:hypothetical protein
MPAKKGKVKKKGTTAARLRDLDALDSKVKNVKGGAMRMKKRTRN